MFKINKEELELNGKKLTLETGKVARQADGAIIATLGETVVLATAVGAKKVAEGQDYFPLSRKILCCWKNTWWLFQKRSKTYRSRNINF